LCTPFENFTEPFLEEKIVIANRIVASSFGSALLFAYIADYFCAKGPILYLCFAAGVTFGIWLTITNYRKGRKDSHEINQ